MFSKTDKLYVSAKHSVIRDMCVDPDELVFTLAQSVFLFFKKDFLNSPTKIFFKMAAKLSKTTAIRREKTLIRSYDLFSGVTIGRGVTCKYEKDPIKNSGENVMGFFYTLKGRELRSPWSDLAEFRTRPRCYRCSRYLQV